MSNLTYRFKFHRVVENYRCDIFRDTGFESLLVFSYTFASRIDSKICRYAQIVIRIIGESVLSAVENTKSKVKQFSHV